MVREVTQIDQEMELWCVSVVKPSLHTANLIRASGAVISLPGTQGVVPRSFYLYALDQIRSYIRYREEVSVSFRKS